MPIASSSTIVSVGVVVAPMTPGDRIECEWDKNNVVVSRRIVRKNGAIDKLPVPVQSKELEQS